MTEVLAVDAAETCDHLTVMRSGSVALHGSLDELRALAPDPGHALPTTDDERALAMARSAPEFRVGRAAGGGLTVTGPTQGLGPGPAVQQGTG